MARMSQLAADLKEIDDELRRIHERAPTASADEAIIALAQIDHLLERRWVLWPHEPRTDEALPGR